MINSTLTLLDLSYNNINNEGRRRLSTALTWNQSLTYLNLASNDSSLLAELSKDCWAIRKNQSLFALLLELYSRFEDK